MSCLEKGVVPTNCLESTTKSCPFVKDTWVEQLADGGICAFSLRKRLSVSGIVLQAEFLARQ